MKNSLACVGDQKSMLPDSALPHPEDRLSARILRARLWFWPLCAWGMSALLACVPAHGASTDGSLPRAIPEMMNVMQTNWAPRSITNVIQVWMPSNVFVTEYHTNLFQESFTNFSEVYKTNWVTRTLTNLTSIENVQTNWITRYQTNWVNQMLTNTVAVELTRTNLFSRYQTNWNILAVTNWETVAAFRTNWVTRMLTNTVVVDLTRTNLVSRYQTNWNMLTLTNWETVLVFRTNWVKQPVTNLVVLNLPGASGDTEVTAGPGDPPTTAATATTSFAKLTPALTLEASRTQKPPANNQFEVQLKLKSGSDAAPALPMQEWRVGRLDGSVFMLGQGRELKLELPPGTFTVEVRARSAANTPLLRVHGTLLVARDGVSSQTLQ